MGARLVSVLEVEDINVASLRGFLRVHIELDATKALTLGFVMPCPETGKKKK